MSSSFLPCGPRQAPLSMEFSRQEYWSGDLPDPGIEPWSPELWADSLPSEPRGKPLICDKVQAILPTSASVNLVQQAGNIFLCCCSGPQSCLTLCNHRTAAHQASLSFTISWSLLKPMTIESVMPPSYLILCHPLLLPPSICPGIRVFSNESVLSIRWPKYWGFSFSTSPSNEYSRFISFRMDWFDLLVVQGTLKSLFQNHSSKALVLRRSAFFRVQLSHPYMTTGKTVALTRPLSAK